MISFKTKAKRRW